MYKHFLITELNLTERYGKNTWVFITGCSQGQGKRFALEFAKRGFNIILSGFKEILDVEKLINTKYNVKTKSVIVDFSHAYQDDFFTQFETLFDELDISILINNVGYRTGWTKYHEMPKKTINDTITVGTIVQARLTQLAVKKFIERKEYSALINVTSFCTLPSIIPGNKTYLTSPYISVYEASNAFGFFHSNSIQKEYGDQIDILNITPGPVITENTEYLKDIPFKIPCKDFVKNVLKMLGNYHGPVFAYWGHEFSSIFLSIFNADYFDYVFRRISKTIAKQYMASNIT